MSVVSIKVFLYLLSYSYTEPQAKSLLTYLPFHSEDYGEKELRRLRVTERWQGLSLFCWVWEIFINLDNEENEEDECLRVMLGSNQTVLINNGESVWWNTEFTYKIMLHNKWYVSWRRICENQHQICKIIIEIYHKYPYFRRSKNRCSCGNCKEWR